MGNTILNTNTGGISPAFSGMASSDGVFYGPERIKLDDIKSENYFGYDVLIPVHETKIIPQLEEVNIIIGDKEKDKAQYSIKAIYFRNPVKKGYELSKVYYMDYDAKEWEEIEDTEDLMEKLNLKGFDENTQKFKITEVKTVLDSIIGYALLNNEKIYEIAKTKPFILNAIDAIAKMSAIDEENQKLILPVPNVENIDKIAPNVQMIYDAFSKEDKKEIETAIKDKIENMGYDAKKTIDTLKKGSFGELQDKNLKHIDENTLYKLADEYVQNESAEPVINADILMAKSIREENPQIVSVKRKILNYDLVGYVIDRDNNYHTLISRNYAIRPKTFYDNQETLKQNAEKYYQDFMNNKEQFIKAISKEKETGLLKLLGVLKVLNENYGYVAPFLSEEEKKDIADTEEFKKAFEDKKTEIANDVNKQAMLSKLFTDYINLSRLLDDANTPFIAKSTVKTMQNELNLLLKNIGVSGTVKDSGIESKIKITPENYETVLYAIANISKSINYAVNLYKENVYSFKLKANETVVPVSDKTRFPKQTGGAVTLNYKDYLNINKYDKDTPDNITLFGFSYKEGGKNKAELYYILKPLLSFNQKNQVSKFNYSISNLDKFIIDLKKMFNLADEFDPNNSVMVNNFKNIKNKIIEEIKNIEKQKGSKLFRFSDETKEQKELFKQFIEELKKRNTPKAFMEKIIENDAFKNIELAIEPSFMLQSSFFKAETVKDILNGKEITFAENEKYQYLKAKASLLVAKNINFVRENETFDINVAKEQNEAYKKVYATKVLSGYTSRYDTENKITRFYPAISIYGDKESVLNTISISGYEVDTIKADENLELKEKFGIQYENKSKKLYEGLKSLFAQKQTDEQENAKEFLKKQAIKADEVVDDEIEVPSTVSEKIVAMETEKDENEGMFESNDIDAMELQNESFDDPFNSIEPDSLFGDDSFLSDENEEALAQRPKSPSF